jgi:hypothetical protein
MKKLFFIITISVPFMLNSTIPRTKNDFLISIMQAYKPVFDKNNLLIEPVNTEDVNAVNQLFKNLSPYVKGAQFITALRLLQNMSDEFFNILKAIYEISSVIDTPKGQVIKMNRYSVDLNKIDNQIDKLITLEEKLNTLQDNLKDKGSLAPSNRDLIEILDQIVITLESAFNKSFRDFDRLQELVSGKK